MSSRNSASDRVARLADEEYISLETFKRDGSGVRTPVWCAPLDDEIVIFSEAKAYKVKRLRRDDRVRMAACGVRGSVRGEWSEGLGRIVDDPEEESRAYSALLKKYGWKMRVANFFSTLSGRIDGRAVLAIKSSE
jgi:PPOX class probable F420-dependent enzyme